MAIYLFFRLVVSFFITLCYRLRLRSLLGRLGHLLLLRSPQKVQLRFRLMTIWLMKIACWLKMIWKSPSYQLVRWIASNLLDFADFLQYIIGHWLNQFLFFFCSFSFSFFFCANEVGDCEVGSTRKACKNCTCGRAEAEEKVKLGLTMDQLNNPQSACGNVCFLFFFSSTAWMCCHVWHMGWVQKCQE